MHARAPPTSLSRDKPPSEVALPRGWHAISPIGKACGGVVGCDSENLENIKDGDHGRLIISRLLRDSRLEPLFGNAWWYSGIDIQSLTFATLVTAECQ